MQPQLLNPIDAMSLEDLRTHLRNAYANTTAQAREIEMLHGMIRVQKAQRDALLAACKAAVNWSRTYEERPIAGIAHLVEVLVPILQAAIRQVESPGTVTVYSLPTCDVCGEGFTQAEWEDRHDGHEPDCPRRDDPDSDEVCECDLVYHDRCCPDCGEDRQES